MHRFTLPIALRAYGRVFRDAGRQAWLVGGAVRDMLLGKKVSDWDVATDAPAAEVFSMFPRVIRTGIRHGTVTVLWRGLSIETTTFRTDGDYGDGRRPDSVTYTADIREDLRRRDFTINSIAYNIDTGELLDPHQGRADLGSAVVRAIGDPAERFAEDGLRSLRAVRFASQLGFRIDGSTLEAIPRALDTFRKVSVERVRDELVKILLSPRPSLGLELLSETGLLPEILPELSDGRGVEQKGFHRFDVMRHSFLSCDGASARIELRLAALLHDIGKPATRSEGLDGQPTFHRHEEESALRTEEALRRLRFPNAVIAAVTHLVRNHMFSYDASWSDAAVRRFLVRTGPENLEDLLSLRMADAYGTTGLRPDPRSMEPLRSRAEKLLKHSQALSVRDLAVGGEELASLGVPRGPVMGRILAELLETVLDDPELNTPDRLLDIASRIKGKHGA
ncbi:MAG TPA: CCA tRNA nucleotidyltransferase [Magnetospirillaceae bacterium]|nr:CCA tRNA nucleotidyltransferase [Magnetospirillaceae bacterium]